MFFQDPDDVYLLAADLVRQLVMRLLVSLRVGVGVIWKLNKLFKVTNQLLRLAAKSEPGIDRRGRGANFERTGDEGEGQCFWLLGRSIEHIQIAFFPIVLYDGGFTLVDMDPAMLGKALQGFAQRGSGDSN